MGFDLLPKNVFIGKDSNGKKIEFFEYDFGTYALMHLGSIFATLFVGGLFCSISSFIILIMAMIHFNGRFNPISITIPILSFYWLYDCHHNWIISAVVGFFVECDGLIFLSCVNIASVAVLCVMTFFGPSLVRIINGMSDVVTHRYVIFFILMAIVFFISYKIGGIYIDRDWLGVTHDIPNIK